MSRKKDDTLHRLESALLALDSEDTPKDCSDRAAKEPKSFSAYNADKTDESPEAYSEALLCPPKSNRGLVLLAVFLTLCIGAVVLYWLLRFRGIA
ncbi:MAG: hypothetical protein IJO04_01815 [Oscillospiraceae bacterium]|nr:hypothetical protein [Oscillospiraceae bacterium]